METEIVNGRKLEVRANIRLPPGIKVGSRWAPADGADREVVVTKVNDNGWIEYLDESTGESYDRDYFSFQCRYCLIVGRERDKADGAQNPKIEKD